MKYLKIFGLAAVAAAALTALLGAGSASATVLCTGTPSGTHCANKEVEGQQLDLSAVSSVLMKTGSTTLTTCSASTIKAKITDAGSTTTTVKAAVEEWTYGGCTTTVDTLAKGTLEFHHLAGTDQATITSSGTEVTKQFLGVSCIFKTVNTSIGTITGGNPTTFDVNGTIPQSGGGFLCPANGTWSGTYRVTTPAGTTHFAAG